MCSNLYEINEFIKEMDINAEDTEDIDDTIPDFIEIYNSLKEFTNEQLDEYWYSLTDKFKNVQELDKYTDKISKNYKCFNEILKEINLVFEELESDYNIYKKLAMLLNYARANDTISLDKLRISSVKDIFLDLEIRLTYILQDFKGFENSVESLSKYRQEFKEFILEDLQKVDIILKDTEEDIEEVDKIEEILEEFLLKQDYIKIN